MSQGLPIDETQWLPEGAGPASCPDSAPARRDRLPQPLFQAASLFNRSLHALLNTIYPPSCLSCRAATAAHDALCPQCWSRMALIEKPYCDRLGVPFSLDTGGQLISPEAFANPPVYRKARAVACFDDGPVRDLVHRLKYGDRVELAGPMGLWMARAGAELLADAYMLIPVPLLRRRLFSRRFN
jgi:predicted amidophosphoribosyltransferase